MEMISLFNHNNNHHGMITNHSHEPPQAQLPPGFRFHPTDEELITYYLLKKVLDSSFTGRAIADVDLNKCEPWELPEKAKMGEKEWYFFSLRDRKYPTGLRTNRATEAGYWKATGKDREILSSKSGPHSSLVGMKKTLVFYRGRAPKGEKSNWVMHEYRLDGNFAYQYLSASSKDEWVISRVFQKSGTGIGSGLTSSLGGKKCRGMLSYSGQPSSPSVSLSLPPLLDTSPFNSNSSVAVNDNGAVTALADRDGICSYESSNAVAREHVSCFSTFTSNGSVNAASFDFDLLSPPQPAAFPSLRSLHENLNLPILFPHSGQGSQSYFNSVSGDFTSGCNSGGGSAWPAGMIGGEESKCVGSAGELEYMWTY